MPEAEQMIFQVGRVRGYDTDAQLARALGVSRSTLSKIKHGERGAGAFVRRQVKQVLGVDLDYYVPREPEQVAVPA